MAKPRSIGGRGCNVGQNTPNIKRAITHRRLSETARRAEIRNQRAILRTASGETGESFPRLKLKSHSPCGDARTVEKRTKTIPNESRTGNRLILPESVNRRFSDSKGTSRLPLNRYGVSPHRDPLQTTLPSKDVAVECSEGKEMSEASPDSLPDGVKGHELQVKITMKKISVTR